MHDFLKFLAEEKHNIPVEKPEKYLSHPEDAIINHGHEGVHLAANYMDDAHKFLTGHKAQSEYHVKYDGGPSVMFGIHPDTKQFFVANKHPTAKNSQANHSKEDVINNHGHKPEMAKQMMTAFTHLSKIMPKDAKPGETFVADIMHIPKDISTKDGHIHFKPNAITYSAPTNSAHGATAKKSKIGIAIHSMSESGVSMPVDKKTRARFIQHPDVHNMDTTLKADHKKYTPEDMKEFFKHKDLATKLYKAMQPDSLDAAMVNKDELHKHIHSSYKAGTQPSAQSFHDHMAKSLESGLGKQTTDKSQKAKTSQHTTKSNHAHNHSVSLDKTLQLHGHLSNAKNVLFHAMAKNVPWIMSHNGMPASPEGIVAHGPDGTSVKFTDRTVYKNK